jgi:hypothetical protein
MFKNAHRHQPLQRSERFGTSCSHARQVAAHWGSQHAMLSDHVVEDNEKADTA